METEEAPPIRPDPSVEPAPKPPKPKVPPLTIAIIVVCVAITIALQTKVLALGVLAPSGPRIWRGHVWGLVTSGFVHLSIVHLLFNVMWTRDFGRWLEPKMGMLRFGAFVLVSAIVTSGWELVLTGETGIGFSGTVYAFFGFMLARRKIDADYAAFVDKRTIRWMLGWLVLCIVLTLTKIWAVGNAAHVAGLVFGWAIGVAPVEPVKKMAARALVGVVVLGSLVSLYMPWSPKWKDRELLVFLEGETEKANAGDPAAQAYIGAWYVKYPDTRAEGLDLLEKSAQAKNVDAMNNLAWALATSTDDKVRSGARAVQWAIEAERLEPNALHLDTLAAAYAESGRFGEAVQVETFALEQLAPTDGSLAAYEARLEAYKRGLPTRE